MRLFARIVTFPFVVVMVAMALVVAFVFGSSMWLLDKAGWSSFDEERNDA